MKKFINLSAVMIFLLMSFTSVNAQVLAPFFAKNDVHQNSSILHWLKDDVNKRHWPAKDTLKYLDNETGEDCIQAFIDCINNNGEWDKWDEKFEFKAQVLSEYKDINEFINEFSSLDRDIKMEIIVKYSYLKVHAIGIIEMLHGQL